MEKILVAHCHSLKPFSWEEKALTEKEHIILFKKALTEKEHTTKSDSLALALVRKNSAAVSTL